MGYFWLTFGTSPLGTFGQLLEFGAAELLSGLLSVQLWDFGELLVNFRSDFMTFGQFGLTFGFGWQALRLTVGLWGTFCPSLPSMPSVRPSVPGLPSVRLSVRPCRF